MTIVIAKQHVPVAIMPTSSSERVLQDSRDLISPPPPSLKVRHAVVAAYSTEEKAYETDEEDVLQRRILTKEAIAALQTLRL